MTRDDAMRQLGVKAIRRVSEHTTVVEYAHGGAAPATQLEQKMWALIRSLCEHTTGPIR